MPGIIIFMDRREELVSVVKSYFYGFLFYWPLTLAITDAYFFGSNYSDLTIDDLLGNICLCLLFYYFIPLVNNFNLPI